MKVNSAALILTIFKISVLLFGCGMNKKNLNTLMWCELEGNYNLLFENEDTLSKTHGALTNGSRVLIGKKKGDFLEVYVKNNFKKLKKNRYYFYKPKYKILGHYSFLNSTVLFWEPHDYSRVYIKGRRGGCFYINSSGNRTYVERSFCSSSKIKKNNVYTKSKYKGDIHVKGHYRRSKSGKRFYVKPHSRRKN